MLLKTLSQEKRQKRRKRKIKTKQDIALALRGKKGANQEILAVLHGNFYCVRKYILSFL